VEDAFGVWKQSSKDFKE